VLIRFEVSNFRSIAKSVELSMVAVDQDRAEARQEPHLGESLVPVAAIYGPNASGKSNVVSALAWLRDAIQQSLRFWESEIPIEPFAFGGTGSGTSNFEIELVIDGIRFEYVLELDRNEIHYEGLFHYPEKKRRRIFEREEMELRLQRGLGGISGTRSLLTPTTLVLAVARRFEEPLVTRFANEILRMQYFGTTRRFRGGPIGGGARSWGPGRALHSFSTMRWFEELNQPALFETPGRSALGEREQALAMLQLADLGISDVLIETQDVTYPESTEVRKERKLSLVHKTENATKPLDFALESDGTRTWFNLIGPVLHALQAGSIMIFDELDASLHPTLSAELLRIFHSPDLNPLGAQLIFTSHDTSLLNHLNRDEVWLTEKLEDGSTLLGALADFAGERVRRSQNLENAYLHGRFGALPQVDPSGLMRALGLIG
jgi:uncharacterized protein